MAFQQVDRVAFVALPLSGREQRGAQGVLDAEAIAERLRQPDAAFRVVTIDPGDDVAGQIDDYIASAGVPRDAVLFYASCRVIASEGELLLLLDGEHPETGDSLVDVADALRESGAENALLVLDGRHASADPLLLAGLAELGRAAARKGQPVVETVAALRGVQPEAEFMASACSPFTRALLSELDETDPTEGLYVSELVERVRAGELYAGHVGALTFVANDPSFPLLIALEDPRALESNQHVRAPAEPNSEDEEVEPETTDPDPSESSIPPASAGEPACDTEMIPPPISSQVASAPEPPSSAPNTIRSSRPPASVDEPPASMPAPLSVPPPSSPPSMPSRPSTPPAPSEVLVEADQLALSGKDEDALQLYRKALSLVGATGGGADPDAERARIHARIGEVKLCQGKAREAIASLEKGLSLSPNMGGADRALATLLTLYRGEKDHRSVHRVEERILSRVEDEAALVPTLLAFGRSWMTDLRDLMRARERLEHARALAPENYEIVRLLLSLAEGDGRTEEALALKRRLADLDPDARARAVQLFEIGRELLKREREDEGLDLLEAALDADPTSLEPLAIMSRLLGDRQEWGELEGAYRRMLDRASGMDPALAKGLSYELEKRLGVLLLEHLDDREGAVEAFQRAIVARPDEPGVRRIAVELALSLGRVKVAEELLLGLLAIEPRDVSALHSLFDIFVRSEEVERAFDVASVLMVLEEAGDREQAVYNSQKPDDIARPQHNFDEAAWPLLRAPLTGAGSEPDEAVELVSGVFRVAGDALVHALEGLSSRAGKLTHLDEGMRIDLDTSTVSVARSVAWASRVIGIELPRVYLEEASAEGMTAVLRDRPVTVLGAALLRGRSLAELAFLAGYHLTGHLTEHRLVRLSAMLDDLAACFLAAVVLAVPDTPVPERIRSLVELLVPNMAQALDADDEAALEEAVMAFDAAGGRADLALFQRSVERASLRVGLLLCGSLQAAVNMCAMLPAGFLSERERLDELFAFQVCDRYRELCARIGTN